MDQGEEALLKEEVVESEGEKEEWLEREQVEQVEEKSQMSVEPEDERRVRQISGRSLTRRDEEDGRTPVEADLRALIGSAKEEHAIVLFI